MGGAANLGGGSSALPMITGGGPLQLGGSMRNSIVNSNSN
jgi:hypothetical protein